MLIGLILLRITSLTYPWSLADSSCKLNTQGILPLSFPDFIVELAYQISHLSRGLTDVEN
jgi:hypothetical protein